MTARSGAGHGLVQRLFARLVDLRLDGARALVAFSGGADSTGLAIGMSEARRARRLRPSLAHIEHRVRPDSAADLEIVLATAERLSLPVSIRAIPDGAIQRHIGCGPEEAMRRERYLLLSRLAAETESTSVLTAHHADDQAETVLGHLIRGAGLEGAAGIRPEITLSIPWWGPKAGVRTVRVVRPLLAERRADLLRLVHDYRLDVVQDATNADLDRTRAALRHSALPMLESIHPGASLALGRFADVAREAVDVTRRTDRPGCAVMLHLDELDELAKGSQRGLVRRWVADNADITLTYERTEAIRRWVLDGAVGCLEIGGGWSILRSGRTIMLHVDHRDGRVDQT